MKTFLLFSFFFGLTSAANAQVAGPDYPGIGGIAVNHLCDGGTHFQTKVPMTKCTKTIEVDRVYDQVLGKETVCVASYTRIVEIPKDRRGNIFDVEVLDVVDESGQLVPVSHFKYKIPACQ